MTARTNIGGPIEPALRRRIAMVAHDNKKIELLRWAEFNRDTLMHHELSATGTTGTMLEYELGPAQQLDLLVVVGDHGDPAPQRRLDRTSDIRTGCHMSSLLIYWYGGRRMSTTT